MKDEEVHYYKSLVKHYRGTPQQVGAGSNYSQIQRFEVLAEMWEALLGDAAKTATLLDFGCGKGDLAAFLAQREGYDVEKHYIGVDGIEENIEDARTLGPYDFRCLRWDGRGPIIPEPVDLIVFSGALATASLDDKLRLLRRMLEIARVGVLGNFIMYHSATMTETDDPRLIDPEVVVSALDRERFRIRLRADYKPHDFTFGAVAWNAEVTS